MKHHPVDKDGTSLKLAVEEYALKIKTDRQAIKEHLTFGAMSTGLPLLDFTALVFDEVLKQRH